MKLESASTGSSITPIKYFFPLYSQQIPVEEVDQSLWGEMESESEEEESEEEEEVNYNCLHFLFIPDLKKKSVKTQIAN